MVYLKIAFMSIFSLTFQEDLSIIKSDFRFLGGCGNVCKTSFGGTGALCLEILSRSYGLRTASGRQVNNAAHYKTNVYHILIFVQNRR